MPAFVKNPKFIIGTIVVLWVAYVIYANFQIEMVTFYLLPFDILKAPAQALGGDNRRRDFRGRRDDRDSLAMAATLEQFIGRNRAAVAASPQEQHGRLSASLQQRFG